MTNTQQNKTQPSKIHNKKKQQQQQQQQKMTI
jgi:hypothetical protein